MSTKSRIAHVITDLDTGGAERTLLRLIRESHEEFEHHVLSLRGEGSLSEDFGEYAASLRHFRLRFPFVSGLFQIAKYLRDVDPAIVQGWMYHGNLAALLCSRVSVPSVPVVWNVRQTLYGLALEKHLTRVVIQGGRLCSRIPSQIIYNSHLSRSQHERLGYQPARGTVIPNGLNAPAEADLTPDPALREALGIPADDLVICHVARFHPMKGQALLLQVLSEIMQEFSNVHAVLVGEGLEEGNAAFQKVMPDGIPRERLHLKGLQKDVAPVLRASNVFVLSSLWGEGCPNALLEAMAFGLCCLASDVGDCRRMLDEGGVTFRPGDPDALKAAIREVIHLSPQKLSSKGFKLRQHVIEHYGLERMLLAYQKLYENLLPS